MLSGKKLAVSLFIMFFGIILFSAIKTKNVIDIVYLFVVIFMCVKLRSIN